MNRRELLGMLALVPFSPMLRITAEDNRRWHVYVINLSHLDVGFHDVPSVIKERIAGFVDDAVRLCDATRDNAPESRYIFTLESSWPVDYYEQHRTADQFQKLIDCFRRGQMEFGAIYLPIHTDLCGHEELARLTYYAAGVRRRFDVPVRMAIIDDVGESYCMGLAQVLARSGVKWFCTGPGAKANVKGIINKAPRIFYWDSPDGSRVLSAWTPGIWTYARWSAAGFKGNSTLQEFEKLPDYPYDIMFRHGGKGDISSPDPKMLELIDSYRKECPEADIKLSTAQEFFAAVEAKYAADIPTWRGDVADAWGDGVISLARETALHRRTHSKLMAAEILAALGGIEAREDVANAYRNLHLYSDHTWGLDFNTDNRPGKITYFTRMVTNDKSIRVDVPPGETLGPGSPLMKPYEISWDAKRQYAIDAGQIADRVMNSALNRVSPRAAASGLVVWNTMSWPRTSAVRFEAPASTPPFKALRERRSGAVIPVQQDGSSWVFIASDVPAFGFCAYEPVEGSPKQAENSKSDAIENRYYSVSVELETALVRSVIDLERKSELVDPGAYGMGQYIHDNVNESYIGFGIQAGNSGYAYGAGERLVPAAVGDPVVEVGPVFSSITMKARLDDGPAPATIGRRVILYRDLNRIDMNIRVEKRAAMEKEQIYIGFPFDVGPEVRFRLELAYMTMDWPRDSMPGTWRGYNGMRNYVRADGRARGVTWTSVDAPIACFGGINSNHWDPKWHDSFVPRNANIYSYVMSNIWNVNYPLWQGGEMQFDYSFMSHDSALPLSESAHFGWDTVSPLIAHWVSDSSEKQLSAPVRFEIEPQNAMIAVVKRPEAGDGIVLRVWECGGQTNTLARIQVAGRRTANVRRLNLVEEDIGPAILRNGAIELELRPHELATLRIEFV
ncbi:MAG: glycosyl hydrolase-related protein [Terracidiphilus sp.]